MAKKGQIDEVVKSIGNMAGFTARYIAVLVFAKVLEFIVEHLGLAPMPQAFAHFMIDVIYYLDNFVFLVALFKHVAGELGLFAED